MADAAARIGTEQAEAAFRRWLVVDGGRTNSTRAFVALLCQGRRQKFELTREVLVDEENVHEAAIQFKKAPPHC